MARTPSIPFYYFLHWATLLINPPSLERYAGPCGDKYAKIEWCPGRVKDTVEYGPAPLHSWETLKKAGFDWVDAVVPIQPHAHRAYFFSGEQYVRIDYIPETFQEELVGAVRPVSQWNSLKTAGFNTVDAAINVPGATNETYFFCNNKYIRASWKEGYGGDKIIEGPKYIAQDWGVTGFNRFDMVLPHPSKPDHAYIFSEKKYVQVKIVPALGLTYNNDEKFLSTWLLSIFFFLIW
ncbi:hypothetical protein OPQ81_011997 [Rhizoctonia solani]|nr:hypothetical protein OPQ81_011997 [Rhizoctonia solani]